MLGDLPETVYVHLLDNAALDGIFRCYIGVHIPQHSLQLIGRKDIAQDVEYLACVLGVEVLLYLLDSFEEFLENPAFTCLDRNKVQDQAIPFLAIPVDTTHPLL